MDIPLIHKFNAGYAAGVKAACPACKVISNYVGTTPAAWNDPTKAKEIATSQASQGADIIYAAAGASGGGVINFVKDTKCVNGARLPSGVKFKAADPAARVAKPKDYTAKCAGANVRPMYFIGVDSNQNYLGDSDNDPKTLNYGLTSMMKRVDNAVYAVIGEVSKNTFKGGQREFSLANNGVGYALDQYNTALIPAALRTQLTTVAKNIVDGKIKVPTERPK
jgi:basic membrane protein A